MQKCLRVPACLALSPPPLPALHVKNALAAQVLRVVVGGLLAIVKWSGFRVFCMLALGCGYLAPYLYL